MLKALTFYRNVLNGEAEDDCPDHSQSHFHISIHNLWKYNIHHGQQAGNQSSMQWSCWDLQKFLVDEERFWYLQLQ